MEEHLVYIRPLYANIDGTYSYEFFFSHTPEEVWGPDWESENPYSCEDLTPDDNTYDKIYKVTSKFKLKTAQENRFYSMEYAVNHILALGWINLEGISEYPENGRMVFHFGDTKEKVAELLSLYDLVLSES